MQFINYYHRFTTWTVWTAGLLVKDALTLVFNDDDKGEPVYIDVVVNYSARGYGRMTREAHRWLDGRMFDKHRKYMEQVDVFRDDYVMPVLNGLKGKEFKSVNNFIKKYNAR